MMYYQVTQANLGKRKSEFSGILSGVELMTFRLIVASLDALPLSYGRLVVYVTNILYTARI